MTQEKAFTYGEGDAWLERNRQKLTPEADPVLWTLSGLTGLPAEGKCLEIGCSNGWRLREIHERYGLYTYGADPSAKAIEEAEGTAGIVSAYQISAKEVCKFFLREDFDVVIYGFCLYLIDREDLFTAVAAGDYVLKDGGLMIIYDFATNFPCKNPYKHKEGLWSFKQDYARMFMASPTYTHVTDYTNWASEPPTKVTVLRKSIERGYPSCD